jgi:cobalt-zinc-cadmium efflux system protein
MAAQHAHDHSHGMTGKRLRTAVALTGVILAVELVGGLLSGSLALLSDAGHVFTDVVALGLAWFATHQAGRPASASNTYGYHRTGILAALANSVTLLLIVAAVAYEAVQRLQHPQAVTPWLMFVSAAVGIALNLYIAFGLSADDAENLNVRAALLHVIGDVAASAGVIVGGLVIAVTHWYVVDPLISLAIAVLIARGAWRVLRETIDILMEASPRDLDVAQLARDMAEQPNVSDVHDLHVWSIAGGMHALSAHVQLRRDCPISACDGLLEAINRVLNARYRINHTTIQFEYACCDRHEPDDLYCCLERERHEHVESCTHAYEPAGDSLEVHA